MLRKNHPLLLALSPVHTSNNVAKNGNNVEATFDTVERIVQLVAFNSVASTLLPFLATILQFLATLLLAWTGLYFFHSSVFIARCYAVKQSGSIELVDYNN